MPEVECPVKGCDYSTPSIDTALIEGHCKHHEETESTMDAQPQLPANSDECTTLSIPCERGMSTSQSIHRIPNKKRHIIGLITCVIGILLDVGLTFWPQFWYQRFDVLFSSDVTTTVGLWRACIFVKYSDGETKDECWDHDDKKYPFNFTFVGAAQVFQCLGVIFLAFAIILVIIKLAIRQKKHTLIYIAGIHAIWAAICFAGSSGVVRTGLERISTPDVDYTTDIQLSYGFAYVSAFLALTGGVILLSTALRINRKHDVESRREGAVTNAMISNGEGTTQ